MAERHEHGQSEHDHARDHDPHLHTPDRAHDHGHTHNHDHGRGPLGWLSEALPFLHGHRHGQPNVDTALETSERGIRALKLSLLMLAATAAFQLVIVLMSGSVALLADTIHNFSDALTAVPLWLAFTLGKRPPNRRYTYGYGRAEDVAGVIIVAVIVASAALAAYESYQRLVNPQPLRDLGWVIVASIVGFLGNEAVALLRIRVGREIGSAALVADGQHARVDGLTSLAVLLGALGVLAGYPIADPIVGLLITVAILFIARDAALTMWYRLMDAVEPEVVDTIERTAATVAGVQEVHDVRVRWLGHKLQAEVHVLVDEDLPTHASHQLAEEVRHALFHALPKLAVVNVHTDPCGHSGRDHHATTAHHAAPAPPERP